MNDSHESSTTGKDSPAQIVDKAMQRIAAGVFLISLAYATRALKFTLGADVAANLDMLKLALGVLAIIIVLPQFVKLVTLRARMRSGDCEPEGFVVDVYKRAAEKGFAFTFIFLLFMDIMTNRSWAELPAEFVVEVVIAVSLAIFSLSFFILNRDSGDDDEFDTESGS